ncbi:MULTISPECIES: long-chain-fatty acid--ACP ligase MbtM [unclassified Mycobacterium]|uniref:long-chain-fatty acid--ACP ligase MbtM n=1 Tax=unclassified Mycobacterium TaxID=2642494 RepID=UPI0009EBA986|nr:MULTISPECIES: long-chain-fatty acid--ACP ligase MbtM [unclassified Mycobacterium]
MTELAAALSTAMSGASTTLSVLDAETGKWAQHSWSEVHARAENIAERITTDEAAAVGLIGDPTVEFIAAIPGAFFAGAGLSILPGPIRRADPEQWAQTTLDRFRSIGVTTAFSHGPELQLLRKHADSIAVHDLAEAGHPRRSTTFRGPDSADVAILQGTAGSTGTPRTAMISPAASLANLRGLVARVNVDDRCRLHSWLPIYHDMGLAFLLTATLGQADLWQAPTSAFAASPFNWLQWLTESQATMTAAPNMAFNLIGKYAGSLKGFDLSNLGFTLNGGEPVDCIGYQRFADEMTRFGFNPSSLAPSYGLAESTCAVSVPEPFSGLCVDDVTVSAEAGESTRSFAVLGHAIPGMEIRINADVAHTTEVTGREVGEVEVRGTSLMTGYVGEAPLDRHAWLPTGDLGYLTDDGLVVCGRAKELITVAGRNVFPTEIERIAGEIDGIRDGCVVAVGTGETSARPGLVIAAEFKGDDEPAARSAVVARVASHCGVVPADVVFLKPGALPRTSSGKLRRLEVKRTLEGASR